MPSRRSCLWLFSCSKRSMYWCVIFCEKLKEERNRSANSAWKNAIVVAIISNLGLDCMLFHAILYVLQENVSCVLPELSASPYHVGWDWQFTNKTEPYNSLVPSPPLRSCRSMPRTLWNRLNTRTCSWITACSRRTLGAIRAGPCMRET